MCTLVDRLLLTCGPTPTLEYALMAIGVVVILAFVVRP